ADDAGLRSAGSLQRLISIFSALRNLVIGRENVYLAGRNEQGTKRPREREGMSFLWENASSALEWHFQNRAADLKRTDKQLTS
ncbi:hypothetical protein AB9F47_34475, partial [Rhizobium leguminosarum]|uniref:hypothetical protein n=1 Tax=Rhizobium leguminosarum TaxID=384 RepID=UPI003F9B07E1